jgi:hypothetical protein
MFNIVKAGCFMKWECFGFIVPAGLLWVFPEFSLVRYWRPDTLNMDEDMDILFRISNLKLSPARRLVVPANPPFAASRKPA